MAADHAADMARNPAPSGAQPVTGEGLAPLGRLIAPPLVGFPAGLHQHAEIQTGPRQQAHVPLRMAIVLFYCTIAPTLSV